MKSLLAPLALAALSPLALLAPCEGEPSDPAVCLRAPRGDGPRFVVVSHPYTSSAAPASVWEVLSLATDGTLSQTGTTFEMGRATEGRVHFTPDGLVGVVVQEDGDLGVFTLDEAGQPTVVHTSFTGEFYAGAVVMGPEGDRIWVLDTNWRENGGGITELTLHCDGHLSSEYFLTASKLPYAMAPVGDGTWLLAAVDVDDSPPGDDGHLLTLEGGAERVDGLDVFGDDDGIYTFAAVSPDGRLGLIGDNNLFSGTGNRIGVADLGQMVARPTLELEDPVDLAFSPSGATALAVSGYGDALFELAVDPSLSTPVRVVKQVAYVGGRPQLPSTAAALTAGELTGTVLVSENTAVRRLVFPASGGIVDKGPFSFGSGYTAIVGAMGVQP